MSDRVFLYCIKCGPYFKVGLAADIGKRVQSFAIGNPFKIRLAFYRTVPSTQARFVERHVHQALAEWRHHGEWFTAPLETIKLEAGRALKQVPGRDAALMEWQARCAERERSEIARERKAMAQTRAKSAQMAAE